MNERQPSFKEPGAVTALRPAGCAVAGAGRPGGLNWGGTVTKLTRQSAAARRAGRAGVGALSAPSVQRGLWARTTAAASSPLRRGRAGRCPLAAPAPLSGGGGCLAPVLSDSGGGRCHRGLGHPARLGAAATFGRLWHGTAHRGPRTAASASVTVSAGWTRTCHTVSDAQHSRAGGRDSATLR